MASSSGSPCAACKFLRRKCTSECVFAPYFPPDQPQKFANVHKIFGASNVTKLLNELPVHQREDAVNSLAYEAEARVKDPVYGCVGAMSILQRQVLHLQKELVIARTELARYTGGAMMTGIGPAAVPGQQQQGIASTSPGIGMTLPGPTAQEQFISREQFMELNRSDQPLTREQLLEYARVSAAVGSYTDPGSLAAFGLPGAFHGQMGAYFQSTPRPGSDAGIPSGIGGPSGSHDMGQLSPH